MMTNVYKLDCNDKRELLRTFVKSSNLVKPEEVITSFESRGHIIVTKNNKTYVPESSAIAAATGVASVAGCKAKLAISLAHNRFAEIKVLKKDNSKNEAECVEAFLNELSANGVRVIA